MESTTKRTYSFPFQPYSIQTDFMNSAYDCIDRGRVGIFESPTGTGKSLSLICSMATWILDQERNDDERHKAGNAGKTDQSEAGAGNDSIHNWLSQLDDSLADAARSAEIAQRVEARQQIQDRIGMAQIESANKKFSRKQKYAAAANTAGGSTKRKIDDENLNQEDEDGGDEAGIEPENVDIEDLLKPFTVAPSSRLNNEDERRRREEAEEQDRSSRLLPQIYFCSRTHSQLSQFLDEIKKTNFAAKLRVTTLGSRKTYCVNDKVNQLSSTPAMNDKCLQLQSGSSSSKSKKMENGGGSKSVSNSGKCPYHKPDEYEQFGYGLLGDDGILSAEQVRAQGARCGVCPYYATRSTARSAHIVLLPYQTLLLEKSRQVNQLDLRGKIIVIDEAHNLLEALAATHSAALTAAQLRLATMQLRQYLARFRSRLNPSNLNHIRQLMTFMTNLMRYLCLSSSRPQQQPKGVSGADKNPKSNKAVPSKPVPGAASSIVLSPSEFAFAAGISDFNLFKLSEYLDASKIAMKISGYTLKHPPTEAAASKNNKETAGNTNEEGGNSTKKPLSGIQRLLMKKPTSSEVANESSSSGTEKELSDVKKKIEVKNWTACPLFQVQAFMMALTQPAKDSRISVDFASGSGAGAARVALLNPARLLGPIVDQARAVILAGGTMEPCGELLRGLFEACGMPKERLHRFTCGHVIGSNQLSCMVIDRAPGGSDGSGSGVLQRQLKLDFQSRSQPQTLRDIGSVLFETLPLIPNGSVVFFPSYQYLDTVLANFIKSGLVKRLSSNQLLSYSIVGRRLFLEPKQGQGSQSSDSVLGDYSLAARHGAVLFAVIGGKMSEGINFADELGRAVFVIGLPYPNKTSPVLQEKMAFLDKEYEKGAGAEYYESLCMKAVNQSIGRAIRHRQDYACVFLVDARYRTNGSVRRALPRWIVGPNAENVKAFESFSDLKQDVEGFFAEMKR